jgi:hypothetical protein
MVGFNERPVRVGSVMLYVTYQFIVFALVTHELICAFCGYAASSWVCFVDAKTANSEWPMPALSTQKPGLFGFGH